MGLLARYLELQGISTVTLANLRVPVERVKTPRVLLLRSERGQTVGPAGDAGRQAGVVRAALRLFDRVGEPGAIVNHEGG